MANSLLANMLMPKQVLTALLEVIINKALSLDGHIEPHLNALDNKSLTLLLSELDFPITLLVNQNVVTVLASKLSSDCLIQTNLTTLPKLKQPELLTSLIKSGELDIIGDPKLAQQFSNISEQLNIDWEQQIATRIGDLPAYKLGKLSKDILEKVKFAKNQISQDAREYLLHEQRIIVSDTEINHFNQQVAATARQTDDLLQKLNVIATKIGKSSAQ